MGFKVVYGLWVTPDFSLVNAGQAKPPRVDHDTVDFAALRTALSEAFPNGPPIELTVANDTIDQVTVHFRAGAFSGRAPDIKAAACNDFGEAMLRRSAKSKDEVLDVRKAWEDLHSVHVQNRRFAPPPTIIPFMIKAVDFEEAMLWEEQSRPAMGLRPFDLLQSLNGTAPPDGEPSLPKGMSSKLEAIFRTPFLESALLARMATSPIPAYARTNPFAPDPA